MGWRDELLITYVSPAVKSPSRKAVKEFLNILFSMLTLIMMTCQEMDKEHRRFPRHNVI